MGSRIHSYPKQHPSPIPKCNPTANWHLAGRNKCREKSDPQKEREETDFINGAMNVQVTKPRTIKGRPPPGCQPIYIPRGRQEAKGKVEEMPQKWMKPKPMKEGVHKKSKAHGKREKGGLTKKMGGKGASNKAGNHMPRPRQTMTKNKGDGKDKGSRSDHGPMQAPRQWGGNPKQGITKGKRGSGKPTALGNVQKKVWAGKPSIGKSAGQRNRKRRKKPSSSHANGKSAL